MTTRLPLAFLRVPEKYRHTAERGRLALYLSSWLVLPAGAWLVVSDELKLLAAGLIGAALMPLLLQMILLPGHLIARRHGRAYAAAAAVLTAVTLCVWTFAAASPVLEREHLPFLLRLVWSYCVATLPLALMAAGDEEEFVAFAGAAQVQIGVLTLAAAQAAELPPLPKQLALLALAAGAAWSVQDAWRKAHPRKE